ncbi:MAG: alpha-galactosidase [Acidobacteriota bacterium]
MKHEPVSDTRRLALAGLLILALAPAACSRRTAAPSVPPPNGPAEVVVEDRRVRVTYNGFELLAGEIRVPAAGFEARTEIYRNADKISQVVVLTARGDGKVGLAATVSAGPESFACEADRRDKAPIMVRHASGPSRSLLNRAVYDRRSDWVLSVDAGPRAAVRPLRDEPALKTFGLEAEGAEIILRFRPRYYQIHRGLGFFEPWTYDIRPGPVAGWISWFAFLDKVTERDIVETADTLADVLLPFGYEYLQIDDGYQRGEGRPELWLNANDKFPRGLGFLAQYIKSRGMKPGIWTNVAFKQDDFAGSHAGWFVTDASGRPARGNWVGFSLDASKAEAVDAVVRPVYRGLKKMGWEYFKVDALRHLRYEGYNAHASYFRREKRDLVGAYRRYVQAIREEIGRDVFLLGCWGIRPELIGLIDGCRIGTDGFSYAGLAQFNSWNNVVWRNDPDHIELNDDRYRSILVTSLTGSILLLTDKPSLYRTGDVRPAKRAAPVLETLPGQIFDVDPSRSGLLDRVDAEVSGSGPRPFDAGSTPTCDLFLLEIDRPFESWTVLGRTGESAAEIRFADLGLDPRKEYFVHEFWSDRLLGSFTGAFAPGPLDGVFKSQSLIIRERLPRPQVLATTRHVTGGGVDLLDVQWKDNVLEGRSRLAAGDPYEIELTEPAGFRLEKFEFEGAGPAAIRREGLVLRVGLAAGEGREVRWTAKFRRR